MLWTPRPSRPQSLQTHVTATTNETATNAITVTASGTAHTKGSYTSLIDPTSYDSFGITIVLAGLQTASSSNQRCLVDIATGPAGGGSESVRVPDLTCGNVADLAAASGGGVAYFFPIYIPAGVRVSARCQASTASDAVRVAVWLHQHRIGAGSWVGQRVTAYGVVSASSNGTSHSPGQDTYATATTLIASLTNPIKAMQLGIDLLADTTGSTARGLARIGIGATPDYVASHLPFRESSTIESMDFNLANLILAQMNFNIAAAQALVISAMRNATAEGRGFIVYGVD